MAWMLRVRPASVAWVAWPSAMASSTAAASLMTAAAPVASDRVVSGWAASRRASAASSSRIHSPCSTSARSVPCSPVRGGPSPTVSAAAARAAAVSWKAAVPGARAPAARAR